MTDIDVLEVKDDMSDGDYLVIFAEAWKGRTLRDVVGDLKSRFSTAAWSKVGSGKLRLNHDMKNELRRYRGMPEVPIASVPDGVRRVVRIGEKAEVMAIFPDRKLTFRMDGPEASVVFPATRVARRRKHICLSDGMFMEAGRLRSQLGVSWDEFMRLAEREILSRTAS